MIRFLKGNHIIEHSNPKDILEKCKLSLPSGLLHKLSAVLYDQNRVKFKGEVTKV